MIEAAIRHFAGNLSAMFSWGLVLLVLLFALRCLKEWYEVRRDLNKFGSWSPQPMPLSAGQRGWRGKAGMR